MANQVQAHQGVGFWNAIASALSLIPRGVKTLHKGFDITDRTLDTVDGAVAICEAHVNTLKHDELARLAEKSVEHKALLEKLAKS